MVKVLIKDKTKVERQKVLVIATSRVDSIHSLSPTA